MSIKNDVLLQLEAADGQYISGQDLADSLGVTRSAVWKAIQNLRGEGLPIDSSPNVGYRLNRGGDALLPELVTRNLPEKYRDTVVSVLESVDSTNNEGKRRLAVPGAERELIIAISQTAGRGRMGRAFYSPADTGLYMSLLLRRSGDFSSAVYFTTAASVAVARAIERLCDKRPMIKWVNDLYLDGSKICGILTEAVSDFESGLISGVVIGIGVNLKTTDFPEEIRLRATALGDSAPGRCELAAAICAELLEILDALPDTSFLTDYRERSLVLGKQVDFTQHGETKTALAVDIDDRGGLIVKFDDGRTETLSSGEISLRVSQN